MSSPVRYDRLKTLDDVRAERRRIHRELESTKRRLGEDYDRLADLFSVDYWSRILLQQINHLVAPTQWVTLGYELVSSLLSRRKKKKKRGRKQKVANDLPQS